MHNPATKKIEQTKQRRLVEQITAYAFVAPMFIGFFVFTLAPLVISIYSGFHDLADFNYNPNSENFIWIENFSRLFADPNFVKAITNTLFLMLGIPVGMFLAFVMATIINSKYLRVKRPYLILFYLPAVSSAIAVGLVWKWLFNADYGPINQIFNIDVMWLSDPRVVKITLIMKGVWGGLGGTLLLYYASMKNISNELYEAADIEGASLLKKTTAITIPLVKQTTLYILITSIIGGIMAFADNYIIVSSTSANTIIFYLWDKMKDGEYGLVSAGSIIVFIVLVIATLILFRLLRIGGGRQFSKRAKRSVKAYHNG